MIQALDSTKFGTGTKFGTLKKPMLSLFDIIIIFGFNGKKKQNI